MTKFRAIIASFLLAFSVFSFSLVAAPSAFAQLQPNYDVLGKSVESKSSLAQGGGQTALKNVFNAAVTVIMSFLGMIAVGIILFAGFKWMTAGGNDDAVEGAQKMLIQGVVGLVIIVAAYLIAQVVIDIIVGFVQGGASN